MTISEGWAEDLKLQNSHTSVGKILNYQTVLVFLVLRVILHTTILLEILNSCLFHLCKQTAHFGFHWKTLICVKLVLMGVGSCLLKDLKSDARSSFNTNGLIILSPSLCSRLLFLGQGNGNDFKKWGKCDLSNSTELISLGERTAS